MLLLLSSDCQTIVVPANPPGSQKPVVARRAVLAFIIADIKMSPVNMVLHIQSYWVANNTRMPGITRSIKVNHAYIEVVGGATTYLEILAESLYYSF